MPKVSVIIPVYNTEKYLPKCLDSVCNQTLKDIEIICVNDCSTDNSPEILQEYAKKDNRIKIVNRERNGGISAARNLGLDAATGEYIYFIDSDDWIDLDYIEKMFFAIENSKANVVLNNNVQVCFTENINLAEKRKKRYMDYFFQGGIKIFDNQFIEAQKIIFQIPWNIWLCLWRKSFLDEVSVNFPEGYIYEDMYFHATTFAYLEKLFVIKGSSYHYLKNPKGLTEENDTNTVKIKLAIFNLIFDFYEKKKLENSINIRLIPNIYSLFVDCYYENFSFELLGQYFKRIEQVIKRTSAIYSRLELLVYHDVLTGDIPKTLQKYQRIELLNGLRTNVQKKR